MSYFNRFQLKDQYGFAAECTPMDQLRTTTIYRLVGTTFVGTVLDPNFWTSTLTNGGTATVGSGQVLLETNTTANGTSKITSARQARYIGASSNYFRAIIRLPSINDLNNTRSWGAFSTTSGAFFSLVNGVLNIVTRKTVGATTTDTLVPSGSFNGNPYVFDTNVNTYEIYYTNSKVYFSIDGSLIHTVSSSSNTWTDNTTLPITLSNTNSGGNINNISMNIRVATINRLGLDHSSPMSKYISTNTTTVCKYGAGELRHIMIGIPGGAGHTVTIYDNTSAAGTILAVIDTTAVSAFDVNCNFSFYTGLTIVTAGGAAGSIVVVYE